MSVGEIEKATVGDLPALIPLALEFQYESRIFGEEGFDPDRFISVWTHLISHNQGIIFVARQDSQIIGAIGGGFFPAIYSKQNEMVLQEMFWYTPKDKRMAGVGLFVAFEDWGFSQGATEIQMVHLVDSMPEKLEQFYTREGYQLIEKRYLKRRPG